MTYQKGHPFYKGAEKGWFKKGHFAPKTAFKKGQHPSLKTEIKKGEHRSPNTEFKKGQKGIKCINYKNGRNKDRAGYVSILKHEHPFANTRGYVAEHRFIIEQHLKRYLKRKEIVHHINGNPSDNRIKNLILFNCQYSHKKFEMIQAGMKKGEIILDGRNL